MFSMKMHPERLDPLPQVGYFTDGCSWAVYNDFMFMLG